MPPQILQAPRGDTAPPIITGLSADLVPPPLYATRHWFYATPAWYYHAAIAPRDDVKSGAAGNVHHPRLRTDEKFYELIDPHLRDLCRLINEAGSGAFPGFRTTPSCEGHFYRREHFERAWADLQQQQGAIRDQGLVVRDSETGESFRFQDPSFSLPWPDENTFCAEAGASQGVGYLGMVLPPEPLKNARLIQRLNSDAYRAAGTVIQPQPQLETLVGKAYYGLTVQARTPAQRDQAWACVTAHLRDLMSCCK